ncbi:MAG: hypothetical protein M5U28_24715 [Sandaracinaceae bacterium]|nr:hypothetical protein [Sandaracinaceae bacterium]
MAIERSGGPRGLLLATSIAPGVLSAFLLNDAICLFLAAPARAHLRRSAAAVLALPLGARHQREPRQRRDPRRQPAEHDRRQPQRLRLRPFPPRSVRPRLVGLAVNAALLFVVYGRRLPARFAEAPLLGAELGARPGSRRC